MVKKPHPKDDRVEDSIGREQVRLAMQQLPMIQAASIVVALVLSYAVRGVASAAGILAFLLSVAAVAAVRFVLYVRFLKVRNGPFAADDWKRAYLLTSLASGIAWGSSAFLVLPLDDPWILALFLVVVTTMSVSSTVFHSSVEWSSAAWIGPAMLPYAARCFLGGGKQETLLAFLIVVYTLVMIVYSHAHHEDVAASIALRFENLTLVKEIRRNEERLIEAQKVARLGYYALDVPPGTWTSSKILDEIFGIGDGFRRDVEGWSLLVHPEERRSMVDYFRHDVLEQRNRFDREYRIVRPSDRSVRWVHGLGKVEYDSGGRPVSMIGTIQDITDRKRTEEEKERLQEQLQQAMKMEAVGRLAGGVAHDFNNLLTALMGNISLAKLNLPPSDPAARLLGEANKASERAALLVQQLLAFSRKQIIEPRVLDLNALIAGLHEMLARLIGEHIELAIVPAAELDPVKVDPGQIEQILVNLAVNARDAMPAGGRLLIRTANVELDDEYCARHPYVRPGRFVMAAVSDTGHGMSEEVRRHLFEPFFTTKPKGKGTGLGLATTYGVVKQSNGSIEVRSEVGKGTTIRMYFPSVEGKVQRPREPEADQGLAGGSETVLLVEDEDLVRDLGVRVLERLGYRVLQAGNGNEAMALADAHAERIDLLMTDVVMPGMGGGELAEQLLKVHPETKVLFTSGYTEQAIVHQGVLDENIRFLGKPYPLSALATKIRDLLDTP